MVKKDSKPETVEERHDLLAASIKRATAHEAEKVINELDLQFDNTDKCAEPKAHRVDATSGRGKIPRAPSAEWVRRIELRPSAEHEAAHLEVDKRRRKDTALAHRVRSREKTSHDDRGRRPSYSPTTHKIRSKAKYLTNTRE
ncbi:hypothetical protein N9L68_05350 [bacterium]|nr:hypothetical protein [bacterium]